MIKSIICYFTPNTKIYSSVIVPFVNKQYSNIIIYFKLTYTTL